MKIVIAIDSFKGSLTSLEAGEAVKRGARDVKGKISCEVLPLADGGEGTMDALKTAYKATGARALSVDPLGREIEVTYFKSAKKAIMEMSASAGLTLLSEDERNPMLASTYGVGLMIRDAIKRGCREFIIGIGGSATNDGGIGMLQALGFSILDKNGANVPSGAFGAGCVDKIDDSHVCPELKECTFKVLCDVTNPLLGENGCTYVYSPQKGATQEELPIMDACLKRYADVAVKYNPNANPSASGCGAAGGIGFAFMAFLGAELVRGIDAVTEAIRLDERVQKCDLVITGEGRMDAQSAQGKAPTGVAKIAKRHGKRVIALCGCTGDGYEACYDSGIDKIYAIAREDLTLEENMQKQIALENMRRSAFKAISDEL